MSEVKVAIIAGNWKMYKTAEEATQFIRTLAPLIKESQALVYLAVPFTAIAPSAAAVKELSTSIVIGAQNMHDASEGAFTGEIAAPMLKEAGAQFVILGHSERRKIFGESDAFVNKKAKRALAANIRPIVCIGETLEEREQGKTDEVLRFQIEKSLAEIPAIAFETLVLAYEPVWAIGTGKVAHAREAQRVQALCKEIIGQIWGEEAKRKVCVLYGGSVKPDNAADLLKEPDIDGVLVGGASLNPQDFFEIIHTSEIVKKN